MWYFVYAQRNKPPKRSASKPDATKASWRPLYDETFLVVAFDDVVVTEFVDDELGKCLVVNACADLQGWQRPLQKLLARSRGGQRH
jgi:hypothetical protein